MGKMNPLCHSRLDNSGRTISSSIAYSTSSHSDMIVIESWLQRHFSHLDILDLKQLSISSGKAAWKIHVTLLVLNHDGNIYDASLMALLASLKNVELPKVIFQNNRYSIISENNNSSLTKGEKKKLAFNNLPISTTIGIIRDIKNKVHLFLDPDD